MQWPRGTEEWEKPGCGEWRVQKRQRDRRRPSLSFRHVDSWRTPGKPVLVSRGKVPRAWASSSLTH